jgi:3-oxoacyl-(acyl-carrier-protein) synthase III
MAGVAMRPVKIAGLSTYVPPRVLTNMDLEKMVETTNEWILQRTGIRERHIVDPGVATSDLAKEAALGAMRQAGVQPTDIGFIVVGTTTPDTIFPSTACVLQHKIGATSAWGFDLGAACSGFTYALTTGAHMVASGMHDHALVVGADVMSSIIDYTDRATAYCSATARVPWCCPLQLPASRQSSASRTRSTAAAGRRCACRRVAASCLHRTTRSISGCTT